MVIVINLKYDVSQRAYVFTRRFCFSDNPFILTWFISLKAVTAVSISLINKPPSPFRL